MKNLYKLIGAVAVLALGLGIYASFLRPAEVKVADNTSDTTFGATAGPTHTDPCFSYGGAQFCALSVPITATSSSICAFPTLGSIGAGSSTLVSFTADIATSSATGMGIAALTMDLSTSTVGVAGSSGGFATSSVVYIKGFSVAAQTQTQFTYTPQATTTANLIGANTVASGVILGNIIAPNAFLNLKIASGTPGTFSTYFGGTCKALFQVTRGS